MKVGTAVANLPHSHPVVIASNAAMLDNLFEGRFILGVGAGILRSDAEALGLLDHDRQAMFVEAIDQVLAIWAGEAPYDIKGKFWNVSTVKTNWPEVGVGAIVKPYQKPHPFIIGHRVRSGLPGADRARQARLGAGVVEPAARQLPWPNHWANYAKGAAEAGDAADRAIWRVARSIFVADDSAIARSLRR